MTQLDGFLGALRPLLDAQGAHAAWVFGSHARGTAGDGSDIDVIVVAPTERPFVDRFRDYLPALVDAGVGVDLLVYTPDEFAQMQSEERPFLVDALADARQVYGDAGAEADRRRRRQAEERPFPVDAPADARQVHVGRRGRS